MLSNISGDKATIRTRIEAAETWIDKKRDEEAEKEESDTKDFWRNRRHPCQS